MNALKLFKHIVFPHLWLNHNILGAIAGAVAGAAANKIFGGNDSPDPSVSGTAALPGWLQDQLQSAGGLAEYDYGRGPQDFFPGQTYADLTPEQVQGILSQQQFSQGFGNILNPINQSFFNALNNDFMNSPGVQGGLAEIERRANRNFAEGIAPTLRRGGTAVGQGFGTRPELAVGVAGRDLQEGISGAQASFLGDAFRSAQQLQGQALQQAPNISQLGLIPGQTQFNLGSILQGQNQLGIDEDVARFNFGQQAQDQRIDEYINRLVALGGTGGSSQIIPGQSTGISPFAAGLAGMQAYSLLSPQFTQSSGSLMNPYSNANVLTQPSGMMVDLNY